MFSAALLPNLTIGVDLGDKSSRICEIDASGRIVRKASIPTTLVGVEGYFGDRPRCRVTMEAGTHSPWISRLIKKLGHEVVVANPSELYGKKRRKNRNDNSDAEFLARQGRVDVELLHPIQHRGPEVQEHLALLRARDQLVRARTKLINHVRGAVKSFGSRIGKCAAEVFHRRAGAQLPAELRSALEPLLGTVAQLTQTIAAMDRKVEEIAQGYPAALHLQQPSGVGALTALAYVLLVEDPLRFKRSRDVGPFFGLVPRLDESGGSTPQLHISKAGDELGRRYLVSAARYILGPFGPDCDLRRYGEAIAARGGKNARKRAAVAVARKLAVMLHRLWVSGAEYQPDRMRDRRAA
jgi:transposase